MSENPCASLIKTFHVFEFILNRVHCPVCTPVYFGPRDAKLLSGCILAMWTVFHENTPRSNLYPRANAGGLKAVRIFLVIWTVHFVKRTDFEIVLRSFLKNNHSIKIEWKNENNFGHLDRLAKNVKRRQFVLSFYSETSAQPTILQLCRTLS